MIQVKLLLDDSVVDGVGDGFGDVADIEFFEDTFTVETDGVGRLIHHRGNLF